MSAWRAVAEIRKTVSAVDRLDPSGQMLSRFEEFLGRLFLVRDLFLIAAGDAACLDLEFAAGHRRLDLGLHVRVEFLDRRGNLDRCRGLTLGRYGRVGFGAIRWFGRIVVSQDSAVLRFGRLVDGRSRFRRRDLGQNVGRTNRRNRLGLTVVDGWIETAPEMRRVENSRMLAVSARVFWRSGGRVFDRRRRSRCISARSATSRFANRISLLKIVVFGHHELIPSAMSRRSSNDVVFGSGDSPRRRIADVWRVDLRHSTTAQDKIVEALAIRHWGYGVSDRFESAASNLANR